MTRTLELLETLVGFPTVSAQSNLDLINFAQAHLQKLGFDTHRIPDATGKKAGIFARIGPKDKPGVMLSGHSDVVPVEGQDWSGDPFSLRRQDDRVLGRGTTDMKGYVAAMLACAEHAAGRDLAEPLKLAISYDEEVGCIGIADMIDQLEPTIGLPRACYVGEPTEMQVAIGHKGKAALRAICHGQAGHSALAPQFVNALHLAAGFVDGLRDLQDQLAKGARDPAYDVPYSTVHVGKMAGGTALNIVPDRAELIFEYRHLAEDAPEDLERSINVMAQALESRLGGKIEIQKTNAYPGLGTDENAAIVNDAKMLTGGKTTKVAFGTEAGYFDALGIPTVVCGPGSMQQQGHKADESISLNELDQVDAFCQRLLVQLCDCA